MKNSEKDTSQKGDFIELDDSEYKKKSNLLRNSIIFLLLICVSFSTGFFVQDLFFKNLEPLKNIKAEKSFNVKSQSQDLSKYLTKDEFNKKVSEIESSIEPFEKKVLANNQKIKDLELSLEEAIEKNLGVSKENNNKKLFPNKITNQEDLINFWILKIHFENREPFGDEIQNLLNLYKENNQALYYINFFKELNILTLKKKEFFLNEINKVLNLYSEDLDELVIRVGSSETNKSKILESKENFFNYIKEIAESTFKVTKLENSNIESNYQTARMKKSFKNELIHAKELLLNDNLDESRKTITQSNYEDKKKLAYWVDELTKVVEANKKLKNFESLLLTLTGKNFDKNF